MISKPRLSNRNHRRRVASRKYHRRRISLFIEQFEDRRVMAFDTVGGDTGVQVGATTDTAVVGPTFLPAPQLFLDSVISD